MPKIHIDGEKEVGSQHPLPIAVTNSTVTSDTALKNVEGTPNQAAPAKTAQVGGKDKDGLLQTLRVTSEGGALLAGWSGTVAEPWRNNTEGTLLTSATRTANTASPIQTSHNARGVRIYLNITAASGTGGLQASIRTYDPVSSGQVILLTPAAITATGLYAYDVYPGASTAASAGANNVNGRAAAVLCRSWGVTVLHGDASNYTYSVGYALIV